MTTIAFGNKYAERFKKAKERFISSEKLNECIGMNDGEKLKIAVSRAWKDLFLMNINGIKNITGKAGNKSELMTKMGNLFGECFSVFTQDYNEACPDGSAFNEVHRKLCHAFLNAMADGTGADCEEFSNAYFGLAQKFVNMTFKYLYCMEYQPQSPIYKYCHMPLDKYTLRWFYKKTGIYIDGWQAISEELYYRLQNDIYKLADPSAVGLSLLESEFVIWQDAKDGTVKCNIAYDAYVELQEKIKADSIFSF